MYLSTVGLSCDFDLYLRHVDLVPRPGTEPRHPRKGECGAQSLDHQGSSGLSFLILLTGRICVCTGVTTDAIPDLRAVNQDKKNMLFSVSAL